MLGLILIYFIGKWHYDLADKHKKNKWLFAILGVVTYYAGVIIAAFLLGFMAVMFNWDGILELPDIVLGLMAIPFGVLATWGLRVILKKNWEKNVTTSEQLLDDTLV